MMTCTQEFCSLLTKLKSFQFFVRLAAQPLYVFDRLLVSSFKGTKESLVIISLLFRLEMQGICTFEY